MDNQNNCMSIKQSRLIVIWCLTSTETIRLIRDGEKGEGGMEVGEVGDYIPIATLSPLE